MNKFEKNKIRANVLSEAFDCLEYRINYAESNVKERKEAAETDKEAAYLQDAVERAEIEYDTWMEIVKAIEKLI